MSSRFLFSISSRLESPLRRSFGLRKVENVLPALKCCGSNVELQKISQFSERYVTNHHGLIHGLNIITIHFALL